MGGRIDGWVDGWVMDGWTDRRVDALMDGDG